MADRLVERVASALVLGLREVEKDVRVGEMTDEEIQALAVAALTAVRMPTNRMLKAAAAAMSAGKRPTQRRVSNSAKYAIRYRAMIDAELRWHERVKAPSPTIEE